MCDLCAMTRNFDPARHNSGEAAVSFASFEESSDAAASALTSYSMSVGDVFSGSIDSLGDRDWVAVTLEAGTSYDIEITAAGAGDGTLYDSYLRLYDSNGTLVSEADDGGADLDSVMDYTAGTTGTYYLSAGAFSDSDTGSYQLAISEQEAGGSTSTEGTLDEMADYLTDGFWEDDSGSRRSFDTSGSNQITVNLTALSSEAQQLARWAFEAWELVADLEFVETSSGSVDILFRDDDSGAYSTSSTSGGTIQSSEVNISQNWVDDYGSTISSYSFSTYIHEIGHALGLGHQGNYNGSATYGEDETFALDSYQRSVMSYFSQEDNTAVDASYAEPVSAMMVDIIAIQNLYGAAGGDSASAGNTTWGANGNLGTYLADVFDGFGGDNANLGDEPVAFAIYDQGGIDMIDLSNTNDDNRLDLNGASVSDVGGLTGNLTIARGTVIENARMGHGDDTVIGNDANNRLIGRGGNDSLSGGEGRDRLFGGGGRDTLLGEAGNDKIKGNGGGDRLDGGSGRDMLIGGKGADRFVFNSGNDLDKVRDFKLGVDLLLLDSGLGGGISDATAVLDSFATIRDGNMILNFGDGDRLKLLGVTDLDALVDDINFI